MPNGDEEFGQSWSKDKRLLSQRVPVMQDFAKVIRGHFRGEAGDHVDEAAAVICSDLLDRICEKSVALFDDAWEQAGRQSDKQKKRVAKRVEPNGSEGQ